MWLELFLCLVFAHLMADYVLQTDKICKNKGEKKWRSIYHYGHAVLVFALSWVVVFDVRFWWCALIIGVSHFAIDMWKSYQKESVVSFIVDQVLHLTVLFVVAWFWVSCYKYQIPFGFDLSNVSIAVAAIVCWKPANIFIKLLLKHYCVNMPQDKTIGFNAGALIGSVERWLILIFVCMQRYDALGLLIAAKSIIRFSEKDTAKTEYVLAGTLLSIFIAVLAGLEIMMSM